MFRKKSKPRKLEITASTWLVIQLLQHLTTQTWLWHRIAYNDDRIQLQADLYPPFSIEPQIRENDEDEFRTFTARCPFTCFGGHCSGIHILIRLRQQDGNWTPFDATVSMTTKNEDPKPKDNQCKFEYCSDIKTLKRTTPDPQVFFWCESTPYTRRYD